MTRNKRTYDAIIVGGGPAGLSAALVLGRCRRRVLVCDVGEPRNAASHAVHGFLTRDGTKPSEVLAIARRQLEPYAVELRRAEVKAACPRAEGGFLVTLRSGAQLFCRKLLLATGVKDRLPAVDGLAAFYGVSVHHCPYCDGWQWRDQPLAVYGRSKHGYALALALTAWSGDIVLCTDGPAGLGRPQRADLALFDIALRTERVLRLEGRRGRLRRIVFESGPALARRAMFFSTGQDQRCDLAHGFGCVFNSKGAVRTGLRADTNVPGLYVAGDSSHDAQFVVVAAAEGAKAAQAMNEALQREELERRRARA